MKQQRLSLNTPREPLKLLFSFHLQNISIFDYLLFLKLLHILMIVKIKNLHFYEINITLSLSESKMKKVIHIQKVSEHFNVEILNNLQLYE